MCQPPVFLRALREIDVAVTVSRPFLAWTEGSRVPGQVVARRAPRRLSADRDAPHQPEKATASWENTINRERGNIAVLLEDHPGMKAKRDALFQRAYALARSEASFETRIDIERFFGNVPFQRRRD